MLVFFTNLVLNKELSKLNRAHFYVKKGTYTGIF